MGGGLLKLSLYATHPVCYPGLKTRAFLISNLTSQKFISQKFPFKISLCLARTSSWYHFWWIMTNESRDIKDTLLFPYIPSAISDHSKYSNTGIRIYLKISSLFPKRGNRNAKRTEKHKNKMKSIAQICRYFQDCGIFCHLLELKKKLEQSKISFQGPLCFY